MSVITLTQIADALGVSKQAVAQRANREAWPYEAVAVRGGQRRLYAPDARHRHAAVWRAGPGAGQGIGRADRADTWQGWRQAARRLDKAHINADDVKTLPLVEEFQRLGARKRGA